jgi:F-type H+/Na+-transporting ATPase subunit alpha
MVATLNQPQYQPWPMEEQVVAIFAGINGYLDDVPVGQVPRFQDELREHLRGEESVYREIREQKDLSDELTERIEAELGRFKENFTVREETAIPGAA